MRTYAFRITCLLSGGDIETMEREIRLSLPPPVPPTIAFLPPPNKATDDQTLILQGGGFSSAEEAHGAGVPVKRALLLAGLVLGVGIDVGNDEPISPAFRLADGQPDERLQPHVNGLQVVPEIDGLLFSSVHFGEPVKRISPEQFGAAVSKTYAPCKGLSEKQILATQLYNESHFHSRDTARFLTLISAVETLVEQQSKTKAARELIDGMIKMTSESDLEDLEKEALRNGLGNLKQEAIGSACRTLARDLCGEAAATAFGDAHNIRHKMVHQGELPDGTDLKAKIRNLDFLVRSLVTKHVARGCG